MRCTALSGAMQWLIFVSPPALVPSLPLPLHCSDQDSDGENPYKLAALWLIQQNMLKQKPAFTFFATDDMTQAEQETQVKYFSTRKEKNKIIS